MWETSSFYYELEVKVNKCKTHRKVQTQIKNKTKGMAILVGNMAKGQILKRT